MQRDSAGAEPREAGRAQLHLKSEKDSIVIGLSGDWNLALPLPSADGLRQRFEESPSIRRISFAAEQLSGWDTGLLAFVHDVARIARELHIELSLEGLPAGVRRLMALASATPEKEKGRENALPQSLLARVGGGVIDGWVSCAEALAFVGDVTVAFFSMCTGKRRFRTGDLLRIIQDCGAGALPIVSLICVLVGLILAFVGSIQLRMFGAQIYIADLVGISMTRAMGAIMTGIIMSGRTGASFAARIGTMQVNEEIDALRTSGIPPVDFLVLPRVIGLAVMMPLLTLYADLMGMLGGLIVSITGFDISFVEYFGETKKALTLSNIGIGCFSSLVFGVLIGLAGCLRGMQCGRSASAVGDATTSAVVTSIVSIIIATAIITVMCNVLRI
jgi:phospholipid/cholesterol/gamma-HCH transport system permease protein